MRGARLKLAGLVLAFVVAGGVLAAAASRFDLPEGPGRELVYGYCQTCHDLQSVEDSAGIRKGAWNAVLDNMTGFGLRINDDKRARILEYLGTYLGPKPPPAATKQEAVAAADKDDGLSVFNETCIACHEADGKGKPGKFPPLAANTDLFLSRDFPAFVVLNGIEGKIKVNAMTFNNVMPPFDFLEDAQIAAVLAYVRSTWGNDTIRPSGMADLGANDVKALRSMEMSSSAVGAMRQSLLH
jgi:mono/diheme cytochrome c family protein